MTGSSYKFCALGALYNGEEVKYFDLCLKSLSGQTIKIPIFIVIDGFIRNELEGVLNKYEHLNIVLFRKNKNEGLAKALQYGLEILHEDYDYVIRFDSDDINREERFQKIREFCIEYKPDLVSSHMLEIDNDGKVFSQRKVPYSSSEIEKMIAYRNPINHPASAFKLNAVLAVGGYKNMPFFEDWYLWLRLFKKGGSILNIDEYLVFFRATDEMVARRFGLNYMKHEAYFFFIRSQENLVHPLKNWFFFIIRCLVKCFGFKFYKKLFFWIRR
jgi:glycosyltransferase involved in cell wall biosynthesis